MSPNGDQLLVADTNNHRIVSIDLPTMIATHWNIDFNADQMSEGIEPTALVIKSNRSVQLNGGNARLDVHLDFAKEADIKFTESAPQKWFLSFSSSELTSQSTTSGKLDPSSGTVQLNLSLDGLADQQPKSAIISFRLNLCSSSVCFQRQFSIEIPLVVNTTNGADAVDGDAGQRNRIRAVLQTDTSIVSLVYDDK